MRRVIILVVLFLTVGCANLSNTPIKKTEEFLKKYQTLDNEVMIDLNRVVDLEPTLSKTQKEKYKDILKKHYQNITYEIKDDEIDGDEAEVTVEIDVTDFKKIMDEANIYLQQHPNEFNDDFGNYSLSKFNDYKLQQMNKAKEKVKYTIEIDLKRINKEWKVYKLEDETLDKINGIYNY